MPGHRLGEGLAVPDYVVVQDLLGHVGLTDDEIGTKGHENLQHRRQVNEGQSTSTHTT